MINLYDQILKTAVDLISIESTHDKKEKLNESLAYTVNFFSEHPLHVKHFNYGSFPSVYLSSKGSKTPDVLLNGHLDVVPGDSSQFQPFISETHLVGRGSVDMKLFDAVVMHTMQHFLKEYPNLDIGIYFSTDEEIGGQNGARRFVEEGYCPKLLINGDGGTDYNIVLGSKGILKLTLSLKTTPGRHSYPWEGENAAEILINAYNRLTKLFPDFVHSTYDNNWHSTFSIAEIRAKNVLNGPVLNAEMDLVINFTENETVESLTEKIRELVSPVSVSLSSYAERLFISDDRPYISQFLQIAEKQFREKWGKKRDNGSSDVKFFNQDKTDIIIVKMPGVGPHTPSEKAELSGIIPMYNTLNDFIIHYFELTNEK